MSQTWSTSASTSGHGKPGSEMSSDVTPWTRGPDAGRREHRIDRPERAGVDAPLHGVDEVLERAGAGTDDDVALLRAFGARS